MPGTGLQAKPSEKGGAVVTLVRNLRILEKRGRLRECLSTACCFLKRQCILVMLTAGFFGGVCIGLPFRLLELGNFKIARKIKEIAIHQESRNY